jgi:hypothetical protein
MRFRELLTEATLSPRDFYKKDRLKILIKRLIDKQPFINNKTHEKVYIDASPAEIRQLEGILGNYDASGNLPKDTMTQLMPNVIGGVPLSSLFKDLEIGGKGGSKGQDEVNVTKFNIGEAVETWKAIGIFAKLVHRKASPITINELLSIRDELASVMTLEKKPGSDAEKAVARKLLSVPDINGTVKDTISIKTDVGLGPWQRAMKAGPQDPALWGRIQGIVAFLNENRALARYAQIFATNGRTDPIKVAVVGGAGKKTDVRTSYLDPETDYKQGKQIVGMSFSLKAGSSTVSQSPGTTDEGIRIMFRSLGLSDQLADQAMIDAKYKAKQRGESQANSNARLRSLVKIMNTAAVSLDRELQQIDNNGEKVFIKRFLSELKNAATSGEGLIFVEFNPQGTYDYLNPHTLSDLVEHIDLESKIVLKTTPYIYIYDKNSGSNLAHIRLEVQGSGRLILKYELDDLIPMAREATLARKVAVTPAKAPITPPATNPTPVAPPQPALKASQKKIGQNPVPPAV